MDPYLDRKGDFQGLVARPGRRGCGVSVPYRGVGMRLPSRRMGAEGPSRKRGFPVGPPEWARIPRKDLKYGPRFVRWIVVV